VNGAQSTEAGQGDLRERRLPPQEINHTSSSTFLGRTAEADGPPGACSEMNESFSPVIFVYGLAFVLGVGKACTLLIWRTLPRSRPGLRQEVREAWQRWRQRKSPRQTAGIHLAICSLRLRRLHHVRRTDCLSPDLRNPASAA